jgi:hypothetical protein
MQKLLYIVLFPALLAGCNNNSATTASESETAEKEKRGETDINVTGDLKIDTLGLAEFLSMKAARFPEANRVYATISTGKKDIKVDTLGWAEYKRRKAKADRDPIDVATRQKETTIESSKPNPSRNTTTSRKGPVARQTVPEVENKSADSSNVTAVPADGTAEKKDVNKRTSNKVKGAIIGGVTGAAAGAVINKKNRKASGVVGGILGAAVGYGIGRHKDKKDTTVKREKQITDNKKGY